MRCIKTGVHAYIAEYSCSVYGDAHVLGNSQRSFDEDAIAFPEETLIIRICEKRFEPILPFLHIYVELIDEWFDMDRTSQQFNSTLIARHKKWQWLSYKGEYLTAVKEEHK